MTTLHDTVENPVDADAANALRAGTWALLGRLLADVPTADLLARLAATQPQNDPGDALASAWHELAQAARAADAVALRDEFQAVFIGVGGGELSPYASWYLTGTLLDRPLIRLRDDLAALGIDRQQTCSEPEDHAAAICEIMALIIVDDDVDLDWQKDMFERYVSNWMGRLFADMAKTGSANFYRGVAALGQAFLEMEQRFYADTA